MQRIRRYFAALALVPVLLLGVSCSTDSEPFGPGAPDQLLSTIGRSTTTTLVGAVDLLTCSQQPYARASKVIGSEGGTLQVGSHKLLIPRGALSQPVLITAEQVRGSTNSVRFSPEGLRFARPAEVTLSYANCVLLPVKKRVVYTDELLKVLELLPSKDVSSTRTVTGTIDHFSRYAVAY